MLPKASKALPVRHQELSEGGLGMRLAASVVVLLFLCPLRAGWGGELGGLTGNSQSGGASQETKETGAKGGRMPTDERKPLANDDVVSMVKAGLAEATIVLAIQHGPTAFDTSPQALIALHREGVPQAVLDAMLTAGSSKPASPAGQAAATPTKGSPPDLHSVRKVFLDIPWVEDDADTARKVVAIQKHTCLQLVATADVADATLTWSQGGFMGATLELHSKDGQVLWSKSGAYSTPLKALKQALGCPK